MSIPEYFACQDQTSLLHVLIMIFNRCCRGAFAIATAASALGLIGSDPSCASIFGDCCVDYHDTCKKDSTLMAIPATTSPALTTKPSGNGAGRVVTTTMAADESEQNSCMVLGCSALYIEGQRCGCDPQCTIFGDCCLDYSAVCKSTAPPIPDVAEPNLPVRTTNVPSTSPSDVPLASPVSLPPANTKVAPTELEASVTAAPATATLNPNIHSGAPTIKLSMTRGPTPRPTTAKQADCKADTSLKSFESGVSGFRGNGEDRLLHQFASVSAEACGNECLTADVVGWSPVPCLAFSYHAEKRSCFLLGTDRPGAKAGTKWTHYIRSLQCRPAQSELLETHAPTTQTAITPTKTVSETTETLTSTSTSTDLKTSTSTTTSQGTSCIGRCGEAWEPGKPTDHTT